MKKMLIVEDDQFISNVYARLFTAEGYTVEVEADGQLALASLEKAETAPTVILLDINLPTMNGRDFLKTIKADQRFKHVPVVILTNSFYEDTAKEFSVLGADLFLVKIQNKNKELVEKINALVETYYHKEHSGVL